MSTGVAAGVAVLPPVRFREPLGFPSLVITGERMWPGNGDVLPEGEPNTSNPFVLVKPGTGDPRPSLAATAAADGLRCVTNPAQWGEIRPRAKRRTHAATLCVPVLRFDGHQGWG